MCAKYTRWTHLMLLCTTLAVHLAGADLETAKRGREFFEKRCTGCHTLDKAKVGPPLRTVFGRRVASEPQFPYSDALKNAQFTWDESKLDSWLLDPEKMIPENDMSFRLEDSAERAAIIAYLKELSTNETGK